MSNQLDVNKLSFNKRIVLVKKEVFDSVKDSKELDDFGSSKSGYYSLATIEKYLHPALDKYNLDLDLEIMQDKVVGHWYDCIGENQRNIEIDFSRIIKIGKLSLMKNEVQSEGGVKTYTRRYALCAILRLPSTDIIEKFAGNQNKNNKNNYQEKLITEKQRKFLFANCKSQDQNIKIDQIGLIKYALTLMVKDNKLNKNVLDSTNNIPSNKVDEIIKVIEKLVKKKENEIRKENKSKEAIEMNYKDKEESKYEGNNKNNE